jgi:hypothetical protein
MGSGAMIYIPSFMKTGFNSKAEGRRDSRIQYGDFISPLLFFQNKECRLKRYP